MKYFVHLIQTSNYEIEVEASDLEGARNAAWDIWTKAPDVEGYAVGPIETDIASATTQEKIIQDHVFVAVRSNPSNCNECGNPIGSHRFPKATG